MLVLLSPAKSLDYKSSLVTERFSSPRLLEHSEELASVLRQKSPDDLRALMKISDSLATLNAQRFIDFTTPFTPQNARAALLAFDGDVYKGLNARSFTDADFNEAQQTVRVLSGLYGVLRPLDLMQPYRLEMGTKLRTNRGTDLVSFWGDIVSDLLAEDLDESPGDRVIVNAASNEYFAVVHPELIDTPVISPTFLDPNKKGELKIIAFHAKRARGTFARWMVLNRVRTVEDVSLFTEDGYVFDPQRSTEDRPTFVRVL